MKPALLWAGFISVILILLFALIFPLALERRATVAPNGDFGGGDEGIILFSDTGDQPPVRFNHFAHQLESPDCTTCHDKLFLMERGSADAAKLLNSESMANGKYCGACHNGEKAFSVKENCALCHKETTGK